MDNDFVFDEFDIDLDNENIDNVLSPLSDTGVSSSSSDYEVYLTTIIDNQNEIIQLNKDMSDNLFRLYYFIGGLYIAFAILIGIKFFKTFLF